MDSRSKYSTITRHGDKKLRRVYGLCTTNGQMQGFITTTANVGTHTVLRDVFQQGKTVTLEVRIGNNTAPTSGDPKYSGEFIVESYKPMLENGKTVTVTLSERARMGGSLIRLVI